jgi:hypothetical protein
MPASHSHQDGPVPQQEMQNICHTIHVIVLARSFQDLWPQRDGCHHSTSRSWKGEVTGGEEHIREARDHFRSAATSIPLGTDILSQSILRALALATGPRHGELSGQSSGILVLSSIGRSATQDAVRSINKLAANFSNYYYSTFK